MCHMSWHFLCAFIGICGIFWQCLLLKEVLQIKDALSCSMCWGEWSIFLEIRFLLKVEFIIKDLASAPAPGNKRTIHLRLIHECDATPSNVKKAQKNYPKIFYSGWTPPPPFWIMSKCKQLLWGGWLPLGKHLNMGFLKFTANKGIGSIQSCEL